MSNLFEKKDFQFIILILFVIFFIIVMKFSYYEERINMLEDQLRKKASLDEIDIYMDKYLQDDDDVGKKIN